MVSLEFFGCSGGMAEGFRRAGITFDFAFDKSPEACDSYEANLGHRPVCIDATDVLRLVQGGWRPTAGELDLIVADPPCTPWSRAGKRKGMADPRDMIGQTCELIRLLRPRAYLIGNVPGLDDSTQWHNVQRVLAPLRKAGYCIADYASLDAADFGVPQHRVRPFWFGHLEGPCIRWPLPTHGPPSDNTCLPGTELLPWVTCRAALQHLPLELLGRPVRLKQRPQDHTFSDPDRPARTTTRNPVGDGSVLAPKRNHPISRLDRPAHVVKTNGGRASQAGSMLELAAPRKHHRTSVDRPACTLTAARQDDSKLLDWPWERPATTVTSTDRLPPPGHHPEAGSILSQPNAVVLSERAALVLQGFPEDWSLLAETKTARWSMLGQAVPPPLAEAVARSVAEQLGAAPARRRRRSA